MLDKAIHDGNFVECSTWIIDNCHGYRHVDGETGFKMYASLRSAYYEGVTVRHIIGMAGLTEVFNYDV